MSIKRCSPLAIALFSCGLAFAAEPAPAPATATEAPAALDPVEVTAEEKMKRQEAAFRTVQEGMERQRSDKIEDEDLIVCKKEKPTGSNVSVINCATNRFWKRIRSSSMASGMAAAGMTPGGTGAYGAGGGGSAKKDDKVITISLTSYYEMEKRFGKKPKEEKK